MKKYLLKTSNLDEISTFDLCRDVIFEGNNLIIKRNSISFPRFFTRPIKTKFHFWTPNKCNEIYCKIIKENKKYFVIIFYSLTEVMQFCKNKLR